ETLKASTTRKMHSPTKPSPQTPVMNRKRLAAPGRSQMVLNSATLSGSPPVAKARPRYHMTGRFTASEARQMRPKTPVSIDSRNHGVRRSLSGTGGRCLGAHTLRVRQRLAGDLPFLVIG